MTDAPKRIWAKTNAKPDEIENWYLKEPREDMTEYVRADIADDMLEALRAATEYMKFGTTGSSQPYPLMKCLAVIAKAEGDDA